MPNRNRPDLPQVLETETARGILLRAVPVRHQRAGQIEAGHLIANENQIEEVVGVVVASAAIAVLALLQRGARGRRG